MFMRMVASVAARSSIRFKRELLTTAFWHAEEVAYSNLAERGFAPLHIIDVGAYRGQWSTLARKFFPDAHVLMIEARAEEERFLKIACDNLLNANYIIALLGRSEQTDITFAVHGTGSSIFSELSNVPRSFRKLKMQTLDSIASMQCQEAPIFLKLDVQGAELEVLVGSAKILKLSEVVQLEVALIDYNRGAPTFAEVIAFMDKIGFSVFNIAGYVKPDKRTLAQLDVLFVKNDSSLRTTHFNF